LILSTQDELLPDGPVRCVGCPCTAVSIVAVAGHPPVWCCKDCERLFLRPAVAAGSAGRVVA
jgi:hypothetical protein